MWMPAQLINQSSPFWSEYFTPHGVCVSHLMSTTCLFQSCSVSWAPTCWSSQLHKDWGVSTTSDNTLHSARLVWPPRFTCTYPTRGHVPPWPTKANTNQYYCQPHHSRNTNMHIVLALHFPSSYIIDQTTDKGGNDIDWLLKVHLNGWWGQVRKLHSIVAQRSIDSL